MTARVPGLSLDRGDAQPARYGIAVGSWIPVRLSRPVASGDPGLVSFRTTRAVYGNAGSVPAGSLIFATKHFSRAAGRLECSAVQWVIRGKAYPMKGLVFGVDRQPGLVAWIRPPTHSAAAWYHWLARLPGVPAPPDWLQTMPAPRPQARPALQGFAPVQPALIQLMEEF